MPKLTKSYIDKLQPQATDALHWDSDLKGFGLRITPQRKMSFIVPAEIREDLPVVLHTIRKWAST